MSGSHEYIIVHSERNTMEPLIPWIESAKVGSKLLAYLIRPGSDFRGDRIRCDSGPLAKQNYQLSAFQKS